MTLRKHGVGEVLPEPGEAQKTASQRPWTEEDEQALREESKDEK